MAATPASKHPGPRTRARTRRQSDLQRRSGKTIYCAHSLQHTPQQFRCCQPPPPRSSISGAHVPAANCHSTGTKSHLARRTRSQHNRRQQPSNKRFPHNYRNQSSPRQPYPDNYQFHSRAGPSYATTSACIRHSEWPQRDTSNTTDTQHRSKYKKFHNPGGHWRLPIPCTTAPSKAYLDNLRPKFPKRDVGKRRTHRPGTALLWRRNHPRIHSTNLRDGKGPCQQP